MNEEKMNKNSPERKEHISRKNKTNNTYPLIIILVLIIIMLSSYIVINEYKMRNQNIIQENTTIKENATNNDKNKEESKNENNNNIETTKTNYVIPFDGTKVLNNNNKSYKLACQGEAGIWVTVDATQKNMNFNFTPTSVVERYPLNWTSTSSQINNTQIKFNKKIVDLFFGGMGQSVTGDTLFILLEDGTVEYIPIVHMFNNVQGAVVSYGKIDGLTDITKFALTDNGDSVTTIAIKSDGSFYDLSTILQKTGNY